MHRELNFIKKILEPVIKKKDGRPKSIKVLIRSPNPRMGKP